MKLIFAVEASEPSGTKFRLGLGITIPFALVWILVRLLGLN
jgi:hypothetical protein